MQKTCKLLDFGGFLSLRGSRFAQGLVGYSILITVILISLPTFLLLNDGYALVIIVTIYKILVFTKSVDNNFRAFWLAPVIGISLDIHWKMACLFAKVSVEEIEGAFFYPSDLVNTKTNIPLRIGEERWIYTLRLHVSIGIYPPLFTSPSGDSSIIFPLLESIEEAQNRQPGPFVSYCFHK